MAKRILLVHAYLPAMAPIDQAFKVGWPEAQTLNVLDEALYADVPADGTLSVSVQERVASLLRHCALSHADGIVFSGSTFGPAVQAIRERFAVPVLKADEAMAERAVTLGKRILLVGTQKRALPIVHANLDLAAEHAGLAPQIDELWVAGARDALNRGDPEEHDRLIAQAVERAAKDYDVIVLGQLSMAPARARIPQELAQRVVTSPDAVVARMRQLLKG
jgi:Asp/Glu/hydantoin racemase